MKMMAGSDRISQLPAEILDNILEFLQIVEAARTAVLSTIWRDIWSSLTQLTFDHHFFSYMEEKYFDSYNITSPYLYVINKVLMQHNGPILTFCLDCQRAISIVDEPNSRKFDLDQWFLFITQKGVEEISLDFLPNQYRLLNCIFSCLTLKWLYLYGVIVEPINAPCIFPNVTSLCFEDVYFDPRNLLDCAANVPMLKTLSFIRCKNVLDFNITAPRLESLTLWDYYSVEDCVLPVNLDLTSICTMRLGFNFQYIVEEFTTRGLQPPELNVKYLKLSCYFQDDDELSAFIHSLRICPKLCKLKISLSFDVGYVATSTSKLLRKWRNFLVWPKH